MAGYGYERVGGVAQPELDLVDPYPERIAEMLRRSAPPADSAAGAEWNVWRPTPAPAGQKPAPLVRAGTITGLDGGPPPPVCVGGLGESHIVLPKLSMADEVARQLLLRMLGSASNVQAYVCDIDRTGAFKYFLQPGLCENIFPEEVDKKLEELVRLQHRISTEPGVRPGTAREPWRILVMTGTPRTAAGKERLNLLAQSTNWGSIISVGTEVASSPSVERDIGIDGLKIRLDSTVPNTLIRRAVVEMAAASRPKVHSMVELIDAPGERMPSSRGLEARIGTERDGSIVTIAFESETPHGLIVGRTGSGKTNFLMNMMSDLMNSYSPEDMQLYLVDGKKSDLSVMGHGRGDDAYFPQLRLLGSNVQDAEDGLAILRHVEAEMDKRALRIGDHGAMNIEGLYAKTGEKLPRILLLWDEVQELLESPLAGEAVEILDRLARQGRSAGVHLMLGTQVWEGMAALVKKPNLLTQFAIRIAMAGGDGLMDRLTNMNVMNQVRKYQAAVNIKGGIKQTEDDNQIVSTPQVTQTDLMKIKRRAWQKWPSRPPYILDGRIDPVLEDSAQYAALVPISDEAVGFVGETPGIDKEAVGFNLESISGRNIAVLGTLQPDISRVLTSFVKSVGKQHRPGDADFSILHYSPTDSLTAQELARGLKTDGHTVAVFTGAAADSRIEASVANLADQGGRKHYVVVLSADRVRTGQFPKLLKEGAEDGTHVVGVWSGLERMKMALGGFLSNTGHVLNGIVALNISQADLKALTSQVVHPTWGNGTRPGRALFFDSTGDTGPMGQVVKLYK